MERRVTILVGTMTGTAELVAADVRQALEAEGVAVEILPMDNLTAEVFERPGAFLVCTSTYGQGDVPDNAQAFLADVKSKKPGLAGKVFGVIGLGDSTYADTFNFGGKQFDDLLAELGARRLKARLEHNASGDSLPEVDGVAWARDWLAAWSRALAPEAATA